MSARTRSDGCNDLATATIAAIATITAIFDSSEVRAIPRRNHLTLRFDNSRNSSIFAIALQHMCSETHESDLVLAAENLRAEVLFDG